MPLVSFKERLLTEVTYDESSSLLKKFKSTYVSSRQIELILFRLSFINRAERKIDGHEDLQFLRISSFNELVFARPPIYLASTKS